MIGKRNGGKIHNAACNQSCCWWISGRHWLPSRNRISTPTFPSEGQKDDLNSQFSWLSSSVSRSFETEGLDAARSRRSAYRRDAAQLPLRLGGTGQNRWLPGTVRAGGFGPQQQGGASRLCKTRADENPVSGRLRTTGGNEARTSIVNVLSSSAVVARPLLSPLDRTL